MLVTVTAINALAPMQPDRAARMCCHRMRYTVCLPNVHLCAARAVGASHVGLAIDEVELAGAPRVTIPQPVLGTGLVVTHAASTICRHLDKVEGGIHPALQHRHIHIECELAVFQVEQLVPLLVGIQEKQARAYVCFFRHIIDLHTIRDCENSIRLFVVFPAHTFESARGCTCLRVRAKGLIPKAQATTNRQAVHFAAYLMQPPPTGVEGEAGRLCRATVSFCAMLQRHWRVVFYWNNLTNLLRHR
mmetsp:Transcript_29972/g.75517  ORF Transcript_29972/g.75517 Transcript_29972/m.75517 type:complete len:246 (+) Transcript_29972:1391-2128(+)